MVLIINYIYPTVINLSKDEITKRGGNSSMIHIDWMIGSKEIDVDGINFNGDIIPVFRKGEWAHNK